MTSIRLNVAGASITASIDGRLTSGMIGVPVTIEYDSAWNGLKKVIIFKADNFSRDRRTNELSTTVPWEVLRKSGKLLYVGVEGRNDDGSLVIPTVWTTVAKIEPGATPNVPGAPNPESPEYDYGNAVLYTEQNLTEEQQAQARENIGIGYFGTPYSSAEQVIDISAAGDGSVKLYLFATDNGYDAIVSGAGAIKNYVYTDATYNDPHEDNRPYDAEKITRLHIEAGISSIGDFFMYKAFNLKHLSFADSAAVVHLGTKAFGYTSIIGEYDFSGLTDTVLDAPFIHCPKLEGVTLAGITEIAEKAFQMNIALRFVKGLSSVTTIGNAAFQYCTSLETIDADPGIATLGNWVFILTSVSAKIEGTETALSAAEWSSQGSICFVPNEWTADQLAAIRAVTGESIQLPIPESDNQNTEFYKHWKVFWGFTETLNLRVPASGQCLLFCLYHTYNILHPNTQYDTYYDFITREIEPRKIEVTQSLYDSLSGSPYWERLQAVNAEYQTGVTYDIGTEISATDLPINLGGDTREGDEGTAFWGVCKALGWESTATYFSESSTGSYEKQLLLDSLAAGKPVYMSIAAADDTVRHAVTAIGYDAETDKILIIDSTGAFDSDVVPLSYWCAFESLINPVALAEIKLFDFGEVVALTDIDNKLDVLLQSVNSGFRSESGTMVLEEDMLPADGESSVRVNIPCTSGAKTFAFQPDDTTLAAIKISSGTRYLGGVLGNFFAPNVGNIAGTKSYASVMQDISGYGWVLYDASVSPTNTDGISFPCWVLKAGTYHWTAYYWND